MLVELDVETTGRQLPQAHIIEVAAVVLNENFHEIAYFQSLANPGEAAILRADREALQVNQITPDMIREAPPSEAVAQDLGVFLDRYWGATFHAFNNEFDQTFLDVAPWLIKPSRWGECVMKAAQGIMHQAGVLRIRHDGQPKWPSLREAAAFFKVPYGDGHRALHDCRVSGQIHSEIIRQRAFETERRNAVSEAFYMMDQGL